MNRTILIVEDDRNLSMVLSRVLQREGYEVAVANTVSEGRSILEERLPGVVLTDIYLPDGTGLEILENAKSINGEIDVIVMTANATVESAISAMKKGAYDYLLKPFQVEELILHVKKIFERRVLIAENLFFKEGQKNQYKFSEFIGKSPGMLQLFDVIAKVSNGNSSVLIQGESGTGKELVARAIHFGGSRAEKMFVPINCSAIPETLLESELFGHVKGAYTGATEQKRGLFEYADQGTLFLDEIGDLSPSLQAKLLRVLEDGRIRRVGDHKEIENNARVVAATNKEIPALIKKGEFREDLYFRMAVVPIRVLPLRERREDIPLLTEHFIRHFNDGRNASLQIGKEAMEALTRYDWPGNVRELKNLIERFSILNPGKTILSGDLPAEFRVWEASPAGEDAELDYQASKQKVLEEFHRKIVTEALKKYGGNVSKASESLGLDRGNFQRIMRRYGLQSSDYRDVG